MTRKQIVLIFVGVVALWAGVSSAIWSVAATRASAGQFGDTFGAVNALFSALAFAGVAVAIRLQVEEMRHAREAAAGEEKNALRTAKLNAVTALLQSADSEVARIDARQDRDTIRFIAASGLSEAAGDQKKYRKQLLAMLNELSLSGDA